MTTVTILGVSVSIWVLYTVGRIILGIIENWDENLKPRGQYKSLWDFTRKEFQKYREERRKDGR